MTIRLTSTATRKTIDTPWSDDATVPHSNWYLQDPYFVETWHEKGKLLSTVITFSEDGLSTTVIRDFIDWDALDEYLNDMNLSSVRTKRNQYFTSVGIEITALDTTEI